MLIQKSVFLHLYLISLNKMKYFALSLLFLLGLSSIFAQSQEERNTILKMAGKYKVEFNFVETFAVDTAYKTKDKYHAAAHEMVVVTENKPGKITLSHFLVVADTIVVKHWRQVWIYENTEFLEYKGNNTWTKKSMKKSEVKGTWTQKVYQVDESPRYESYGKWVKEGNEMVWYSASCMSPLPRRELLVREDYNIIQRRSRIVVGYNYWYLEQDNYKLNGDTILCHEKGMERFTAHEFNSEKIDAYWNRTGKIWMAVIAEWNNIYEKNDTIQLKGRLIKSDYLTESFNTVETLSKSDLKEEEMKVKIKSLINDNCIFGNI